MTREEDKKKIYRLMVSAEDFHEARSYLEAIEENISENLRYAAVLASVIAYCRPFQKSDSGKGDKSDRFITLDVKNLLSQSEARLHKQLIIWRGHAIAHSSFNYRPAKIIGESDTSYSFISVPSSHYLNQIDPASMAKIAEIFRQEVLMQANKIKKKIGGIDV